jgi:predicted RNA-binding protein with PUA-like domain
MPTFLLKTEPSEYAFSDLVRDKKAAWTGVANAQALATLRTMRKGDFALIYHTGDQKAIVGLAKAVANPYEDPEQRGTTDAGTPKFAVIDLAPVRAAKSPVTLATIKADKRFANFAVVKQSRLSVIAVPEDLAVVLREMSGL